MWVSFAASCWGLCCLIWTARKSGLSSFQEAFRCASVVDFVAIGGRRLSSHADWLTTLWLRADGTSEFYGLCNVSMDSQSQISVSEAHDLLNSK